MNRRGEVRLPKSDQKPLRFDQHAMVGITNPLDPAKYPFLKDKSCQAITILPKSGFSVRGGVVLLYQLWMVACDRCLGLINVSLFFRWRVLTNPRVD